ncbi:TIGR02281 family clan AA aspartic protease [Tropicibacter sp. R16_0]|uniref:retropepsin-like aspartic protease family protein n=1 Tax=Tropicibacter sp. R16_0 TaxID=2821102 RepID=UPI001ADBC481|nr:TIGR02281 family clan AA aspartic protease [Tropicibacter sp. R16_0]MBO9449379.1 TIGR02281 family clan AA aspartic protease [Tropicibacter sp. R16_0]
MDFDADNIARLGYLGLLGAAVLMWFVTHNRQGLGKTLQQALIWVFIFMGVIAVVGLWEDIRTTTAPSGRMITTDNSIVVPRARDGHYYLQLLVNGKPVDFLVDTGASQIVLSQEDSERIGIDMNDLNYFGRALTANGEVRTAPINLDDVVLGPFKDRDLTAWVNEGEMDQSLLGMEYLQRFSTLQISPQSITLAR